MKRILNRKLEIQETQKVRLPIGSRLLSAVDKFGDLVLYAECPIEVDSFDIITNEHEDIEIRIYGVYHNCPNYVGEFLNTVVMHGGAQVWQVYYVPNLHNTGAGIPGLPG